MKTKNKVTDIYTYEFQIRARRIASATTTAAATATSAAFNIAKKVNKINILSVF